MGKKKWDKQEALGELSVLRHSASHIMAQAVRSLYPEVKLGIGPAIENGFYYDFEREESFREEELAGIEDKMREIVKADLSFIQSTVSREDAREIFETLGEKYKLELLEEIPDAQVGLYRSGDFMDLCKGPHLPSTGGVNIFKLLDVAGAYWRGDETRPMLQRIYGTAFRSQEELDAHLQHLEEARRRDHRRLGPELDLYSFRDEVGPGLALWHPKGAIVRKVIEDFWKEVHLARGYELVYTPHVARRSLWETTIPQKAAINAAPAQKLATRKRLFADFRVERAAKKEKHICGESYQFGQGGQRVGRKKRR